MGSPTFFCFYGYLQAIDLVLILLCFGRFEMIVIDNFKQVIAQIESERGIDKEVIISAVEQALVSACRKRFPEEAKLESTLDENTGEAKVYRVFDVVETVENDDFELTLADAKAEDASVTVGGEIRHDVTPDTATFGRIAAQTAKQVIIQRIREAEKTSIYEEYEDKVGNLITGTIQRIENQNYLINLGRVEAILHYRQQIPGETFYVNDTVKVYLEDIERTTRGSALRISRTHPGLLEKLIELEIPEIQDGIITVKSVARDPGKRAKVAVTSNNPAIGAVGTCVGPMGSRIQSVIKELGAEKIDVLEWDEDPKKFIANAMKPAKVSQVIITNNDERTATVVVPNDQLSLAIGKSGVNVRLCVKLTQWKLDVINEDDYNKNADTIIESNSMSLIDKIKQDKELLRQAEAAQEEESVAQIAKSLENGMSDDSEESTKVSDLAKLLNLKTKELIEKSAAFGVEIKSVRSKVTPEQVEIIKEKLR